MRTIHSKVNNNIMSIIIDINTIFVYNYKPNWCIYQYATQYEEVIPMNKTPYNILPATEDILKNMGEQIKLARLRRNLSAELVAERAGISRASLWNVEKGSPSVAIGIYAAVLHALNNMDKDLLLVARDDAMGRKMQDLNLLVRKRAPRKGV